MGARTWQQLIGVAGVRRARVPTDHAIRHAKSLRLVVGQPLDADFLAALYGAGRVSAADREALLAGHDPSLCRLSDYDLYHLTLGRLGAPTTQSAGLALPELPELPELIAQVMHAVPTTGATEADAATLKGTPISPHLPAEGDVLQLVSGAWTPAPLAGVLPAASAAGRTLYDTGSAWSPLAAGAAFALYQSNGAAAPSWVTSLSGITISGSANTLTNIGNSSLTYSSVTLTQPAAGLSITSSVALGGTATFALADDLAALEGLSGTGLAVRTGTSAWAVRSLVAGTGTTVTNGDGGSGNPAVNVTYGTAANTATQGNDTRLAPAPSAAGRTLYDTGSAWSAVPAGAAGALYQTNGAAAPSWVTSLSGITISGTANTLTNIGNSSLTNSQVTYTAGYGIAGAGAVSLGATGSIGVSLVSAEASLGATQVDITTTSYASANLAITLPAAGTYLVWAEMRQGVQVSASPNGAISTEFYNVSDASAVANSERIGVVATQVNIVATGTIRMSAIITVADSKTIAVYAKRTNGPTYTASGCYLYSDTDGRSRIGYVRLA